MPTPVSTGSLTIADLNDGLYALLSSETGLVHCDSAGTPTTPLTTTPLTTMMTVYKGNSVQTGFSFTRTASSGVTSSVNSSGVLSVTGLTVDSGWVDITASKSGEPSITKRYVISKVKQGIQGGVGPVGQGIDSITEQYAISTSKTTPPAEGSTDWKDVAPTWSTGKYLWTRSKIVYKNPAETVYTTPVCDNSWEAVNVVKDELNTIENHYGYKYFTDITVYGDSDKLYPVIIKGGDQGTKRDIFVRRGYSELAPPDWYTSTHKGDLVAKIKCNFGGWGGANYSWEIHELEEMYSRTFAGCLNVMSNMAFAIFLRGGGTTGARYHLYSNQSLTTEKYGYPSPQICYDSNELIGEYDSSNGTYYTWYAPAPKTFKTLKPDSLQDSDQQAIDVRNFIPLSKKSVKSTDVEYYLSTSATSLSGGAWQTTAPAWVDGKFMWSRTKTTLNDGTVNYTPSTNGTCIAGAKGATGTPAIMGLLTNDSHVVPTDSEGNNGNFNGCSTTVKILVGTSDDSANWSVTATPTNVTGNLSGKTYTVESLSADVGYVDFSATRSGYTTIPLRFTITRSKQGSTGASGAPATAYWLVSSVAAIKKSIAGAYTPTAITFSAKSQTGTSSPVNYAGRFKIYESANGSTWTLKYTSSANEVSKAYTPSAGIVAINCELYLAGGVTTLIDQEIVPIVSDGATGSQGPAGTSITSVDVEYAISTSNTTAPTTGWDTTSPAWEDGKYLWARTKTTYSVGEPTYTNPACITGGKGETGDPGQLLGLNADTGVILFTSRGVLVTEEIKLTIVSTNIPIENVTISRSDAGALTKIDNYHYTLDCSTVMTDTITVEVTATYLDKSYSSVVNVTKYIDPSSTPYNFGGVTVVPNLLPDGGWLVTGDYFLWTGDTTSEYVKGEIYEYNETTWVKSNNGDLVMTLFDSFADLANDVDSTVIGNAVIKKLVAIEAFIENLFAEDIALGGQIRANYDTFGNIINPANAGFWLGSNGKFKAQLVELVGQLRTGNNARTDALVAIQDASGITSGPTFTGSGLNDLSIVNDGDVAGNFKVQITGKNSDDAHWEEVASGWTTVSIHGQWWGVTVNSAGRFVAVSIGDEIAYSDDGINWTTVNVIGNWHGVAVNSAGRFVAVCWDKIAYSDNGIAWTTVNLIGYWDGVTVNSAGRFVAVGNDKIAYSDNGINWTTVSILENWRGVTVNSSGRFVVVANNDKIAYSDNGINWTTVNVIGNWQGVTVNSAGRFVAVSYYDKIAYSDNGINWTTVNLSGNWWEVTVNSSGRFVAVGDSQIAYSDDGINWTTISILGQWHGVAVNSAGRFVAVDTNNKIMYTKLSDIFRWSPNNGTTWYSNIIIPNTLRYDLAGYGITIAFVSCDGHVINDLWVFTQGNMRGLSIIDSNGDEYFSASNGNVSIKNVLGNLAVTGAISGASLAVTGAISGASINTGYGAFEIGQNLRTSDAVTFATVNTGYGANEVYKITNEAITAYRTSVQMSAMVVGEIRFVYASLTSDSDGSPEGSVKLPAGGSYLVANFYDSGVINIRWTGTPQSLSAVGISGGTKIVYNTNNSYRVAYFLVRRIS